MSTDKPNKETIEALKQVDQNENVNGPFKTIRLENTKENRMVQQVAATMGLSGYYLSEDLVRLLQEVASGKLDVEDAIEEWAKKCTDK